MSQQAQEEVFIRAVLFVNAQPHIRPLTRILWYLVLPKYKISCPSLNGVFMGGIVLHIIGITDIGAMHYIRFVTIYNI